MNTLFESLEPHWLTKATGDPFTDIGGYVIQYLSELEQYDPMNILELIEELAKIYVYNWGAKLNAFFLNSTITQPAFNSARKVEETVKYYSNLIEEKCSYKTGYCRISGRETKIFYAGRDNHIMSGSGGFINFHHGFEEGLYLSKEVLIRIFFAPFGLMQLSDKIALIHSNREVITRHFVAINIKGNLDKIGSGISEGVLKSEFRNPANALFGFADRCISELNIACRDEDDINSIKDVTLNLYHFTNFGASPDIELHTLQSIVFHLHAHFINHYKQEWTSFIRHHYYSSKFRNARFNELTDEWETDKEKADYETYKSWKNPVLENLLNNKSLVPLILKWSINHIFNFHIVELYQINVRRMEQRTLKKIKELADFIVRRPDSNAIKKDITKLDGIQQFSSLRRFLIKLIRENYKNENPLPLITVDDYVDYLFPEGKGWIETRDLLLIAIYQKLHELPDVKVDIPEPEYDIDNNNED